MPFVTQGKTNWSFILIIIILAVIVGGGSWWYAEKPEISYLSEIQKKVNELNQKYQAPAGTQKYNVPVGTFDNAVDANNQFALDLYSRYKSKEKNVFFSSFSISSALTMVYEGAKAQTANEIKGVLHLSGDKEEIRSDYFNIYDVINKPDKSYQLSTANALWTQKDYPFIPEYLSNIQKYYSGEATNLDFINDTENSRLTINKWVENKTNDRIKDIIPKGMLSPSARLVLTNAIYFKADWLSQFNAGSTNDQDFKLNSGTTVNVKMMHQTNSFKYGETNTAQFLELPYVNNDLSMLVILPKDNKLNEIENSLSLENLDSWKNSMETEKVQVSLPKFKIETEYLMAEDLKTMGMPTAFGSNADFTGMSLTGEIYISQVIHKTFIEVAEYGTEAAAATAIIMETGAAMIPEEEQPKVFTADHPFIFMIQDNQSGNILFFGTLLYPTE